MKTSARNQFDGTVVACRAGAVNDLVDIQIPGGARIVAVVTHESAATLGLKPGARAFALVQASSVIVATELGGARLSARNRFAGTVVSLTPGAVDAEVVVDIGGGTCVAAIVTQASLQAMGLVPRQKATVLFKASSVLVGVPG